MAMSDGMMIGVFARRSRLSPKALRLYDQIGLLQPSSVDRFSGYRTYSAGQLEDARLISRLRRLQMPLDVIGEVLRAADPAEQSDLVIAWWNRVEADTAARRELVRFLTRSEKGTVMAQIDTREVPEQQVLTEQRHTTVNGLDRWISEGFGRLMQAAEAAGGVAGAAYVIYHGEVNEDSDGPVELCVPVSGAAGPGVAARTEPAHREAYLRIPKSQVEFPQILGAYEQVEQWVRTNGHTPAGAPREIYFNDFLAAGPDDLVCDVAWPIG
jgi:DNA-binding transcriptional MerR regulator